MPSEEVHGYIRADSSRVVPYVRRKPRSRRSPSLEELFRYPTRTKLLEVERRAETAYLRAYEADMRLPTQRGAERVVKKANALIEARALLRSYYP